MLVTFLKTVLFHLKSFIMLTPGWSGQKVHAADEGSRSGKGASNALFSRRVHP
jgi:hypothetical protein